MAIYYYVPEQNRPSWGSGMIYYHVWLLRKNSLEGFVLHDTNPYKLNWLKLDVPIRYISDKGYNVKKDDFLVIPEFYADLPQLSKLKCRKIVFVQNSFYIFDGLKKIKSYEDLGIEKVFYYMPHLKKVLQQITSLPLYEMPPFVAPYFYSDENIRERENRIILYPKSDNRDYSILKRILDDKLGFKKNSFQKLFSNKNDWEIAELRNKSHQEVAEEMKQAAFFISLNTTEAFNSSVPEAMAAGCINICYEGVGPADFLENNVNAYVFSNNHVYPMVEKIMELVETFNTIQQELEVIRRNAIDTANKYRIEKLENCIVPFFSSVTSYQAIH